jgi:hypothetical protein
MRGFDPDGFAETEANLFQVVREWFDMRDLEQVAEHVHVEGEIEISQVAEGEGGSKLVVNKITWAQVGLVTVPGRYMFKFGWLTITADDLAVWKQYPSAAFTLYGTAATT